MKPTTVSLSRALSSALALSVMFGTAFAEPISDRDLDGTEKTAKSYAQEYSEVKEDIASKREDYESKKDQLKDAEERQKNLKKYDSFDDNDSIASRYESPCACTPYNSCPLDGLIAIGAIQESDVTTGHVDGYGKACDPNVAANTQPNPTNSGSPTPGNPNTKITNNVDNGTGGPKGKKGCVEVQILNPKLDQGDVCLKVYNYSLTGTRSGSSINRLCVQKARECGAVKYAIDKDKLPKEIADLKADIAKLEKELKKLIAKRDRISTDCPHCKQLVDDSDAGRPQLGDYIVGGLQAISPMVIAGIQAGSYNRYLKTNLTAYNGYLSNSLANCQAYISQGTTLGVPSSPCMSSMWSGGIAQAPGGGGYGIYGAIGMSGAVGAMYGYPGGYAPGYGAYGYGGYSGVIGAAIGSMYGGGYGYPGAIGMGYGMYGGGYGMPGAIGAMGYGQIGGGYGMYGGGYGYPGAIGGGYGMYGGGYGYPGAVGMAVGMAAGGLYMGGGGYGLYGTTYGGYPASYGSYVSTMGYGGSYSYGIDPSYQLNAARMQMQQQNMMFSGQQANEAAYRYQQIANQGMQGYGMAYGASSIGGYGYGGYGYGYGGYPAGYGYGGYGAAIGSAIGSLFGMTY
ncbi:MAG: hypothetical protein JST04_02720 [Bdellovibrionales bacterium]|nr:hypothetical protein [Bdellovibrionales bacterium]